MSAKTSWYQVKNGLPEGDQTPEILIYDVINPSFGVSAADFVQDLAKIDSPELTVRINSPGGAVFDGIAILNAIRGHDAKVTTVIDGLAASIASVIAMGGDEIVMNKNSQMMIHNAWDLVIGNADELQAAADRLRQFSSNIASIYADRAGGSVDEWQQRMDDETWYTADEAVEAGLANSVLTEPVKSMAMASADRPSVFDLSIFKYAGRQAAPAPAIAARAQAPQPTEAEVNQGKEHTVPTLNEGLAERLGINADANDETILQAVDEALAERADAGQSNAEAAEPTVEQLTAVASAHNLIVVDKAAHDKLVADVTALNAVRNQQLADDNEQRITNALKVGKIAPASADTWRQSFAENREQAIKLLDTIPANSAVAITPSGHGVGAEDSAVDPEMEGVLALITGRPNGKDA